MTTPWAFVNARLTASGRMSSVRSTSSSRPRGGMVCPATVRSRASVRTGLPSIGSFSAAIVCSRAVARWSSMHCVRTRITGTSAASARDDLDVVVLHSSLPRVDAVPGNVDDHVRAAFSGVRDGLHVIADHVLLRVPELDPRRVVDRHWHTGDVVSLDVLGHWLAGALLGQRNPEHGVDERALPDAGLSADEDVRVPELSLCLLPLGAEVRRRIGRDVVDIRASWLACAGVVRLIAGAPRAR